MKYFLLWFCMGLCLALPTEGRCETSIPSLSGYIRDAEGDPIPYTNLWVKELQTGTTSDENGYFFLTFPVGGEYEIIVSSMGYETQKIPIIIESQPIVMDITMLTSALALDEIVIRASKRDPAYAIIQAAIDAKKAYLTAESSYRTNIYVKATEVIETEEKPKKEKKKDTAEEALESDPFEAQKKADNALLSNINMVEMQVTLSYQYPKQYKEERTAYKKYGTSAGLFLPRFGETDFNFYNNMVALTGIAEGAVISPLATTSILSYKFKLIESKAEGAYFVHKIKVTPRKAGNATCEGYIYINEGIWNINRLELDIPNGNLKFFDTFTLKQDYTPLTETYWWLKRQEFLYTTTQGRYKTFTGNTLLRYADFDKEATFPDNFFGNEVVVTTKEAYERDSSFWNSTRPEALTTDQSKMVSLRDSIYTLVNSKPYKDSLQAAYNKVTLYEVAWDGVGYRNHEKKTQWYFGSIPSMLDFSVVGGWRVGPYTSFFKRWESGRMTRASLDTDIGFKNKDILYRADQWLRYNPHKLADISWSVGRSYNSINPNDAFLNQLKLSNYILNDEFYLGHRFELINGLYFSTDGSWNNRQSIRNLNSSSFLTDIVTDNEEILDFKGYQAFVSTVSLSYTPAQKFMTEPNRKVVLGSKWPTFTLLHRKGWNGILNSDINFDYVELEIRQDLQLGPLGHSNYILQMGDFLNTKGLQFIDLKRIRQSDPIFFSKPLRSFQLLDTALTTTRYFVEFHHLHHFNGAFINTIPLINKTGIRLVAGGGVLWMLEGNYRHQELLAGIERVFKLGPRRRLRLGLYGVAADGNYTAPATGYKISLDIIDTWKRDWSF